MEEEKKVNSRRKPNRNKSDLLLTTMANTNALRRSTRENKGRKTERANQVDIDLVDVGSDDDMYN